MNTPTSLRSRHDDPAAARRPSRSKPIGSGRATFRPARRRVQSRGVLGRACGRRSPGRCDPWLDAAIDWDRTIAFREHLWDLGLGVAEAMDTAQRGMGLDWPASLELIRRSVAAARATRRRAGVFRRRHRSSRGAGRQNLDDVIRAYEEQIAAIEEAGGRIILMATRALAKLGRSADDYAKVYDRILAQVREPVIIHWLGDMFDPALAGLLGRADLDAAMERRSTSSPPTPPRSTASRSRCSTRTGRSPCAAGLPRACACIPATISTMPN